MFNGISGAWWAARAKHQFQQPYFNYLFSSHPVTYPPPWETQVKVYTPPWMTEETRSIHPNALPGHERAEVPRSKVEGYALNPVHEPDGRHKARVFKSALGFDQSNWELLKQTILDGLPYHEAKLNQTSLWGDEYDVDLVLEGPNGNTVEVRTK